MPFSVELAGPPTPKFGVKAMTHRSTTSVPDSDKAIEDSYASREETLTVKEILTDLHQEEANEPECRLSEIGDRR